MPETNHPMSGAGGGQTPLSGRDASNPFRAPDDRERVSGLGIAITTLDGFFTFVNTAWAEMHGYSPEDMLGRHLSMCHTGAQMANLVAPLDERAVQRGQGSARIRHIDKYGNLFATFMTVTLQPGRGRQLPHLIRVADTAQQSAKGVNELPVNWLDETGALILDLNTEGRVRYANQRWLDAMGFTHRDLGRLRVENITRPEHREQWRSLLRRLAEEEDTASVITVFVTRAGREVVVEGSLTAHVDDAGLPTIRAVLHDITQRRRVEREVRAQRALAQTLRDTAVVLNSSLVLDEVLVHVLDNVGRVVEHDAAALLLVDEGVATVLQTRGVNIHTLQYEEFAVEDTPALREMFESGQPALVADITASEDFWLGHPDWLHAYVAAPIRLKSDMIGFLVLLSATPDLYTSAHAERLQLFADHAATALHNAQLYEEIQRMVSTLHERNADLKAFGHTIAHDLKAPLQVLIGYSNLLSSDATEELSEETREGLKYIEAYSYKMKSMIDNLLLFSELGSAEVSVEPVDMQTVISLVLARFYDRINQRGVKVEVSPDLPDVMGFSAWVEEVFANLIDNAIKYIGADNPDPRVQVRGTLIDGLARIEVSDNGVGIRPADQANLFQMFTRFHQHQADGSGLGLSIARRIVQKLHGEIGVESEVGQGTTFWVELPAAPGGGD